MEPSSRENAIDPYQPPAENHGTSETKGPAVLKDLRILGWLAVAAISIQCLIGFATLVIPFTSSIRVDRIRAVNAVAFSLSIILFLRWVHGVAANTRSINAQSGIDPAWCVGCYLIPFVNWVAPYVHMRSFIRECHPQGPPAGMQGLAVAWWVSFQFRGIAGQIFPILGFNDVAVRGGWVVGTLVSWGTIGFLVTRISRRQFEFRWSDLPPSRRPQRLERLAKDRVKDDAQPQSIPEGAPPLPRRTARRPITVDEQNRLIREMHHSEDSKSSDP